MGVVGRLDQYASMLAWEFDDYSMSENLLTYSEQFDNASWAKNNYNVTANATTAPDGTLTADKLIAINASTFHDLYKTPALGSNTYTLSIFAKAAEQSFIRLRIDDSSISRLAMFDLTTGSVSSSSNVTSPTITSYPNGWYRCSITVSTNIINVVFNGFPTSSNVTYSGDGVSGVFIWGAQFEYGSVATDYTPTTTTAISRVLPATTNTNITGLGTYYSSGFDENVGFTTFLSANIFAPYDLVYDEFGGTLFGAGQGRYMRQNTDKSVIVYNEIDEVSFMGELTPSTRSVDEGSTVTFNLTNSAPSTTLYWTFSTISGTINTSDFTGAAVSGSFSTNSSGIGSTSLTLANDGLLEGTESFQLQVRSESTSGTILATSATVTINDTSIITFTPGLAGKFFNGSWRATIADGNIGTLPLTTTNDSSNVTGTTGLPSAAHRFGVNLWPSIAYGDNIGESYGFIAIGYFTPPTTGTYTIFTSSDDYSGVWIGDLALAGATRTSANATVNNGMNLGAGGQANTKRSGTIALTGGVRYPIRIVMEEANGGDNLTFSWSGPGILETTDLLTYFSTPSSGGVLTGNY
jgi:hypothetical protein